MSAIKHGWQPAHPDHKLPSLAVAREFHAADKRVGRFEHADGGSVGSDGRTMGTMHLIAHALDRASATLHDPHHLLTHLAAGLMSQLVGEKGGKPSQWAMPGIVKQAEALPAGLTQLGHAAVDTGAAAMDHDHGALWPVDAAWRPGLDALRRTWDAHPWAGPKWSQDADTEYGRIHDSVNRSMGLHDPQGFAEHAADFGGQLLGQLPLPAGALGKAAEEAPALRSGLSALLEYTTPTWRPSLGNWASGTALGGLSGMGDATRDTKP